MITKELDTVYSVFGKVDAKQVQELFSVVDLQTISDFIGVVYSEPVSVSLNEAQSIENLFPNSLKFLERLYAVLLDCIQLKLGVDISDKYSAEEIQMLNKTISSIPTKFIWSFVNITKEQIDDYNADLPVIDYLVLAVKKEDTEKQLGVGKAAEAPAQKSFDLQAELDDI